MIIPSLALRVGDPRFQSFCLDRTPQFDGDTAGHTVSPRPPVRHSRFRQRTQRVPPHSPSGFTPRPNALGIVLSCPEASPSQAKPIRVGNRSYHYAQDKGIGSWCSAPPTDWWRHFPNHSASRRGSPASGGADRFTISGTFRDRQSAKEDAARSFRRRRPRQCASTGPPIQARSRDPKPKSRRTGSRTRREGADASPDGRSHAMGRRTVTWPTVRSSRHGWRRSFRRPPPT
jgi:hypothetical protein